MKKRLLCTVEAAVLAVVFIFAFSTRTSPLYSLIMGDYILNPASSAMLLGKCMVQGIVPYRDLFISAGPFYLLIQAGGWMLHGRMGIFALESLNLFFALLFVGWMACRDMTGKKALFCELLLVIPFAALAGGGNSSVEWLLGPITFAFWLITGKKAGFFKALLLGLISGVCLMISPAALGIVAGCLLYYLYKTEKKHRLIKGIGYVLAMAVPLLAVLVYAIGHGALQDMIHACVILPIHLLRNDFDRINLIHKCLKCSLVILPFLVGLMQRKKCEFAKLLIFVSLPTGLMLMLLQNNWVTYLVTLPMIGLAFLCVLAEEKQIKTVLLVICILGVCVLPGKRVASYMYEGIQEGVTEFVDSLASFHRENPDCKIFMKNTDSSYELYLDMTPQYKYFHVTDAMMEADADIAKTVQGYMTREDRAELLVDSLYGQWNPKKYEGYTLAQAFIKYYGNLCVYLAEKE